MNVNMTVLDRQRAGFNFQQEQQLEQEQDLFGCYSNLAELCGGGSGGLLGEVVNQKVKPISDPDPDPFEVGWPNLVDCYFESDSKFKYEDDFNSSANICMGKGGEMINHHGVSNTSRCPQEAELVGAGASEKMGSCGVARDSFRKRKADKVDAQNESGGKRSKEEAKSKITHKSSSSSSGSNNNNNNQNKEQCGDASKENVSKITEVRKPDYIHVRARRGQATDSHSLAERVRREKISERMKYLQDLVPGCNKVTGKAGMLDEIINYVQSLQRQVEFLSMKLAAVNPKLDFNFDSLFSKEAFPACSTAFPSIGMSTDMASSSYLQFNPLQQQTVTSSGFDMGLKRIIGTPLSVPETFISPPCFNIQPTSIWNADPQNLYNVSLDQGRSTSFPSQSFAGQIGAGNLKMEML